MNETLIGIVLLLGFASGWGCFGVLSWVWQKTVAAWEQVHRLQEERHALDARRIQNMEAHVRFLTAANQTMAQELTRRQGPGGRPPSAADDAHEGEWWKRQDDSGTPPRPPGYSGD